MQLSFTRRVVFPFCVASMSGRECCGCFGGGMCALISVHLVGSRYFHGRRVPCIFT